MTASLSQTHHRQETRNRSSFDISSSVTTIDPEGSFTTTTAERWTSIPPTPLPIGTSLSQFSPWPRTLRKGRQRQQARPALLQGPVGRRDSRTLFRRLTGRPKARILSPANWARDKRHRVRLQRHLSKNDCFQSRSTSSPPFFLVLLKLRLMQPESFNKSFRPRMSTTTKKMNRPSWTENRPRGRASASP